MALNIEENLINNIIINTNQMEKIDEEEEEDYDIWDIFDDVKEEETEELFTDLEIKILCKSCGTKLIDDFKSGTQVCRNCGLENSINKLDRSFENNNLSNNNKVSSRYGCPSNFFLPKSSLGTVIGGKRSRIQRLHQWSSMPYKERSLLQVFKYITDRCRRKGYRKYIIDSAYSLYNNLSQITHKTGKNKGKKMIIRGNNRKSLIAACVFYAAKLQGTPRSPKEIAGIFGLELTEVTKGCRKFIEIMGKDIDRYNIKSSRSADFVERFGKKLKLDRKYVDEAIRIANNIAKLDYASDHQPPSIAASSLLLIININGLNISKDEISKIVDISQVTISKIYTKIEKFAQVITNDESVNRIYRQIQDIKLGNDSEENSVTYSESVIFSNQILTNSTETIPELVNTTDSDQIIKPGKRKSKNKRKSKEKTKTKTKTKTTSI